MEDFFIAMDNYFTLPKIIKKLRDWGIGVVGTSRFRKNWPPKKLRAVEQKEAKFNDFYWTVDEFGTLVARWIDNGIFLCISKMHKVGSVIKRKRKHPRVTKLNRRHVNSVWGENGVAEIFIPTLIDD